MTDLKTTFAGLSLRNPIIISSSGLTNSAGKNKRLAEAGAGAIVLKSLFEEQIMLEADQLKDPAFYPEASDYLEEYIREHKLAEYLTLIKESKKECNIPIIASINCYSDAEWIDFAKQIQEAGADALEINILALQSDVQYTYGSFEQRHIDILRHIKRTVSIPVIMKLGDNLTNPVALIDQLYANGAAAVVLFNRFYQPDINIENMEQISGAVFSTSADLATPLRWIGIASSVVDKIDYAASGGVSSPEAVVKAILAGATAVEVCSAVYQNTNAFIGESTRFLSAWMERKGFESIAQFKGKLNIKEKGAITDHYNEQAGEQEYLYKGLTFRTPKKNFNTYLGYAGTNRKFVPLKKQYWVDKEIPLKDYVKSKKLKTSKYTSKKGKNMISYVENGRTITYTEEQFNNKKITDYVEEWR